MTDPLIATSLRWLTRLYVEAATTGRTMTVEPEAAATFAFTLEAAVGRLEEIDQLTESDDRVRRELRIQEAEVARLQLQLAARDLLAGPRRTRTAPLPDGPCKIVDLSEELGRERRDAGRPIDGGAA